MITKDNFFGLIYHFLFAISSSVVGAIVASWPLLFIFMLVQKTYETVHMSLFQVMHNYNQLMIYLIWPFKKRLKIFPHPLMQQNILRNVSNYSFLLYSYLLFV